jgi:hypothetical protein
LPCTHLALPPHSLHQCLCFPWSQIEPPLHSAHIESLRLWMHTLCPFRLKPGLKASLPLGGVDEGAEGRIVALLRRGRRMAAAPIFPDW